MCENDTSLYELLGELNSLQRATLTEMSTVSQARRQQIIAWLDELPHESMSLVCRVNTENPIARELSAIIQHLLISEPYSLETTCFLCWQQETGSSPPTIKHISPSKTGSCRYGSLVDLDMQCLSRVNLVWDGTRLLDIIFIPLTGIVELMSKLSTNQCFTRIPPDCGCDVDCIDWLRSKSRFSLGQLLVACLELNIWKHYGNGSRIERGNAGKYVPTKVLFMQSALKEISMKCGGRSPFRALVEQHGQTCLRRLFDNKSDRIPLYLTIMKKRIQREWFGRGDMTWPSQYPSEVQFLWVLTHLTTVVGKRPRRRYIERSLTACFSQSGQLSTAEVIMGLISVPLCDSFSFMHELITNIREEILSDFACRDLLDAGSVENSAPLARSREMPRVATRSRPPRKARKGRRKRLVLKSTCGDAAVMVPGESIAPSHGVEVQSFSHSIPPSAVTDSMVSSTRSYVIATSIVDEVVCLAVESVDLEREGLATSCQSTVLSAAERSTIIPQSVLSSNEHADQGAIISSCDETEGDGLIRGLHGGDSLAFEHGDNMQMHDQFPHWSGLLTESSWRLDGVLDCTSTSSRFSGLFSGNGLMASAENDDDVSFFRSVFPNDAMESTKLSSVFDSRKQEKENMQITDALDPPSRSVFDLLHREEIGSRDQVAVGNSIRTDMVMPSRGSRCAPPPLGYVGTVSGCDDAVPSRKKRSHSHDNSGTGVAIPSKFMGPNPSRNDCTAGSVSVAESASLPSTPTALKSDICGIIRSVPPKMYPSAAACPPRSEYQNGLNTASTTSKIRRRATSAHSDVGKQRSLSPLPSRAGEAVLFGNYTPQKAISSGDTGSYSQHELCLSLNDCGSTGCEDDQQENSSLGEFSGFGFDDFDSVADGEGSSKWNSIPSYGFENGSHTDHSDHQLVLAISCSCLRSQADSAVLRNIIALQRSMIVLPQAVVGSVPGMMHISPYYDGPALNMYNTTRERELEVMSDSGDFGVFSRHTRNVALGGAATLSSLCSRSSRRREAVDDAGFGQLGGRQREFDRLTSNSRSLSGSAETLNSTSVDGPLTGEVSNTTSVPHPDDKATAKPFGTPLSAGLLHIPRRIQSGEPYSANVSGEESDNPSRSDVTQGEPAFGIPSTSSDVLLPDVSSVEGEIRGTAGVSSRQALACGAAAESRPAVSPSAFVPTVIDSFCTMSEFGGGIPSPLTIEICSFVSKIDKFDSAWHSHKMSAIDRMSKAVQSLWPRAQVKAFGSFVSGLSLPSSDLDLVICLPKVHKEAGPEAAGFLEGRNAIKETWQRNLARCLSKEIWVDVSSIKVISSSLVPVIKLKTVSVNGFSVSLDVSFEGVVHQGLEANKLCKQLMNEFLWLRPIVLILKQFLSRRGLCESYTGGLSSYALLLITARFLQEQPQESPLDVGAVLLGLLDFFGNHLQPAVTGISVSRRCYFSRIDYNNSSAVPAFSSGGAPLPQLEHTMNLHAMNRRHSYNRHEFSASGGIASNASSYQQYQYDPLFIEDPLAHGNNVGRNCFRIQQIQRIWSDTHAVLLDNINTLEGGIATGTTLLYHLVGDTENAW